MRMEFYSLVKILKINQYVFPSFPPRIGGEDESKIIMENELKSILVKIKRGVLSDILVAITHKSEEGILIDAKEIIEIVSNLSEKYER